MASKEKELELNVSPSMAATLGKLAVALLGAMAAGGAGSVALAPAGSVEQEDRLAKLEESCQRYDVRISTAETRLESYQANMVEVRKDLAEIRSTNTQILFLLQKDK